jgi:Spy/CpxP family protein refolding chaperone
MTKRILAAVAAALFSLTLLASPASANPNPPTNGGSANGGGQSGQCTGANADRPASCHNGNGDGN